MEATLEAILPCCPHHPSAHAHEVNPHGDSLWIRCRLCSCEWFTSHSIERAWEEYRWEYPRSPQVTRPSSRVDVEAHGPPPR